MNPNYHLVKEAYKNCDFESSYFKGVLSGNLNTIQLIVGEFDRVVRMRGLTELGAVRAIRLEGGVISTNSLNRYRRGLINSASATYMNILSRFCGYTDFCDLAYWVKRREIEGGAAVGCPRCAGLDMEDSKPLPVKPRKARKDKGIKKGKSPQK